MSARVPAGLDPQLLQIYLSDHLAGAVGALNRLELMSTSYADLPIHEDIVRLTAEIHEEREWLGRLISSLGLGRRPHQQVLARLGELAGRLKLNGRVFSRSPLSPLLELELLRGGVTGKLSLWQSLLLLTPPLPVDRAELERLEQQAHDQLDLLTRAHQSIVTGVFQR